MIYITVELNKPVTIKIPKNITGTPDYKLMMDSQAGGQQFVFQNLNDLGGQSVFKFVLVFETYTPGGTYNYRLYDSLDKIVSKGLIQVNTVGAEDYFYDENELGYFVDESESGDMSNYYTKSQVDSMLTQYEKKSDLPDFNNFVTEEELGEYVTSEELQQEVSRQIDEKHIITEEDLDQSVESYINSKDLVNSTQLTNTLEWYVTDAELQNMGYVTTLNLRQNYYNKPETEANFTSYTYLEERISRIPGGGISMDDVKNYVVSQSYVTSDELSNTGYVTSNDLSNMGYITLNDIPAVDLSSYVTYTYLEERIGKIPGGGISMDDVKDYVVSQSYITSSTLNTQAYITATQLNACGYATVSQIPTVSNAGIVLRQGGVTKGSFSLNQSTGVTIDFDEGGSGSGVTMEEVKQYVVSQSYVTGSALNNMAYITSNDLTDYATKSYVETKIADIDLSSYLTKQELVNQAYITSNDINDYATKAYVQEKINEIPGVDMSSYVSKSDLNNYGYQTSAQVQNIVNTSINSLNSYTLVFTLADDSTVTVIAYTK